MSRPLSQIIQPSGSMAGGPAPTRQPSLTEELERLEQSITLTLQEIDRNFSQCHRIITHSIMPIIDRYGNHSQDLCDNVGFWKSFFEDSAAVAIGTYESKPEDEITMSTEETTYDESSTQEQTETTVMHSGEEGEEDRTISLQDEDTDSTDHDFEDDSILASMNLTGGGGLGRPKSRTKSQSSQKKPTKWAPMQSPYDKLKSEVRSQQAARRKPSVDDSFDESMTPPSLPAGMSELNLNDTYPSTLDPPTTPETLKRKPSRPISSRVLDSSPVESSFAPSTVRPTTIKPSRRDPLLHRAVDTNWRIQATPQKKTPRKAATTVTPKHRVIPSFDDESPMSSPPPPQITTVFSPIGTAKKRFNIKPREKPVEAQTSKDPKTPVTAKRRYDVLDPKTMTAKDLLFDDEFDDDDDDDFKKLGFSPPVTMQFTLPPSRLMQTPAKQASKMLVNDIMRSAGFRAGFAGGDDTQTTMDNTMDSPSMLVPKSPTYDL